MYYTGRNGSTTHRTLFVTRRASEASSRENKTHTREDLSECLVRARFVVVENAFGEVVAVGVTVVEENEYMCVL